MSVKHCDACKRPLVEPPKSYLQHIFLTVGLVLAVLAFVGVGTLRDTVVHLESLVTSSEQSPQPSVQPSTSRNKSLCKFPIIYNKPHKTASTRIQTDILRWARALHRPFYTCSGFINQATMQMRECIPDDHSGCAVIATHVVMSPTMTKILESKIGKFFLITSTRHPRERLVSMYLQMRGMRSDQVTANLTDLKNWLSAYDPWTVYNYHTGDNRVGKCPLDEDELMLLPDLANKADLVLDADLHNVTQAILNWKGLFKLSSTRSNVRYSKDLILDTEADQLIKSVSCVEEELHRLHRLRMASLYEKATGKRCLSNSRHPTPCF